MRRALKAWFGHWSLPVAMAVQAAMGFAGPILHRTASDASTGWDPVPTPWLLPLGMVLGWRLRDLTAAEAVALVPGHARIHALLLSLVLLPLAVAMTALPFLLGGAATLPTWALAVSLTALATCMASGRWPALTLPLLVAALYLLRLQGPAATWADISLLLGTPLFTVLLLRDVARRPCREPSRVWQRIERAMQDLLDRITGWWPSATPAAADGNPVRLAWRQGLAMGGGWVGMAVGTLATAICIGVPAWLSGASDPRAVAIGWLFASLVAFMQAQSWAMIPDRHNPAAAGWNRRLVAQLRLLPGDRRTTAALTVAGATAYGLSAGLQVALGTMLGLVPSLAAGRDWAGPMLALLLPASLLGAVALGSLPALALTCRGWIARCACIAPVVILMVAPAWLCVLWNLPGCLAGLFLLALAALLLPPFARHRLSEAELP